MRYYLNNRGETGGPYPANQIKSWTFSGKLADDATVCEEFSQEWLPVRQSPIFKMKTSVNLVATLGVLAALILVPLAVVRLTSEGTSKPLTSGTPLEVRLGRMLEDYSENEIRADGIYNGKLVRVTGTVRSIGKAFGSSYVMIADKEALDLSCQLEKDAEARAASLSPGSPVTVRGRVTGRVMSVMLSDCEIE